MRKLVIGLIVAGILLVGVPLGMAAATGETHAIKALIWTLRANLQAYVEFLEFLAKGDSYNAPNFMGGC